MIDNSFKERAIEAISWMLETSDIPELTVHEHSRGQWFSFENGGFSYQYREKGWRYEDNPWRSTNMRQIEEEEGVYLIAKCPRHGGSRVSSRIYTNHFSLSLVGKLKTCNLCDRQAVIYLPPAPARGGGYYGHRHYCKLHANCGLGTERLSWPESLFWTEPHYWTEEEIRKPCRETLAAAKRWAEDVECDSCVELVSFASPGFGVALTHASLRRTYQR